ncbi:acid type B receptor subunit 2 [Seminavis robusta]|uniref:Acid type B receptor subunit 2 n=1 Tax=Seminavis robusta TaxID=568900 RepID=A0A9N8DZ70_9STRA|nr:acid type B receptor subunit 2 [Seminavis robusta]|eukprot:Sro392_g133400.1 acid type B receptor subunit 2 (1032) ;mRNA; r:35707-39063
MKPFEQQGVEGFRGVSRSRIRSRQRCLQVALFGFLCTALPACAVAQTSTASSPPESVDLDYQNWKPCEKTSLQFAETLTPEDDVHPCILYDIQPSFAWNNNSENIFSTNNNASAVPLFVVTLVQVTPAASNCQNGRDGAVISVERMNAENEARGQAIGFQENSFVQFRLVSIVAGHSDYISGDHYKARHATVLDAALTALKPQYVIGTCSFASDAEDKVVLRHQIMLLAQVGPPSYYQTNNPYLFGFHLNSDGYPLAAARALSFDVQARDGTLANQPVKVLYRKKSEFFHSTCRSAIDSLKKFGFTNILELLYDHDDDHDGDGIKNQFDVHFLNDLADQACPRQSNSSNAELPPAIFACFQTEQDMVFQRWRENGCCPMSIWLTAATWGWAAKNIDQVPYIQGGGQWHQAFTYSDRFFSSGQELLEFGQQRFEYFGSYDFVVSYSIPTLFAEHLKSSYRVADNPDPAVDFQTADGYEKLRRDMVILTTNTLFGPVAFDKNQRNIGRAAAATQWLPESNSVNNSSYYNALVSPADQAEALITVPSPSAKPCPPGQFSNETMVVNGTSLLTSKCSTCPQDTITFVQNNDPQCSPCPEGTTTQGQEGETKCYAQDMNLIPQPVLNFGAVISSSTILALSQQAGFDDDISAVTTACRIAPFLYCIGWPLQYGSIASKTFRIYRLVRTRRYRRARVSAFDTSWIVILVLLLDMIVVTCWTIVDPLEYRREVSDTSLSEEDGLPLVTISSYGFCAAPKDSSIWRFAAPIAAIHLLLMIITNWTLYTVKDLEDRYQEQKYVGLSSAFVFEVLVIGLPVLLSLDDNPSASYLVLIFIIFFNDAGILLFIFVPKMHFQRIGLTPGVGVAESLRRSTHEKAVDRQKMLNFQREMEPNVCIIENGNDNNDGNVNADSGDSFAVCSTSECFGPPLPPGRMRESTEVMESSGTHVTLKDSAIMSRSDRSNRTADVEENIISDWDTKPVQDMMNQEVKLALEQENVQLKEKIRRLEMELEALLPRSMESRGSYRTCDEFEDKVEP